MRNGRVTCGGCGRQVSVTSGTLLQDCRLPLGKIFQAALNVVAAGPGISALKLQAVAGLSRYETALSLLARFRIAMAWPEGEKLGGRVALVTKQIPVAGAGERAATVFLALAERRCPFGQGLVIRVILEPTRGCVSFEVITHVNSGAEVVARRGGDYAWLAERGYGYIFSAVGDGADPLLERCDSLGDDLAERLRNVHRGAVRIDNLQGYCNEFAFRSDYGNAPSRAFRELMRRLVNGPLPSPKESDYVV